MKLGSPIGILALAAAGLVAAQNNLREISLAVDPTGRYSFCRLFFSRSAVVGTKLYIDGGSLSLSLSATNLSMDFSENNNRLLIIDLSTTFTTSDHSLQSHEKPASEPIFNDGIMFSSASGNGLIAYGGFYPHWNSSASGTRQPSSSVSATRSFDISSSQWSAINGVPGLTAGAGVSIPGTGRAWYLGGAQDDWTTQGLNGRLAVKGMLEFSGTSVKNLTTPFDGVLGAMMVYIPGIGKEGILVKMGGEHYAAGVVDSGHSMVSMEEVDIYDISSGTWYTQNTTGDPKTTDGDEKGFPKARMIGCAVAASAPDNSSHHIYMYGGGGKYFGDLFDEVWVLSLPIFRWTKVYGGPFGLCGNTCHLAGKRYMLSVGGYRSAGGCITLLGIYDISELRWVDTYYPNTAYFVPAKIATIVGGTSQGGAAATSPEVGWGANLEAVFRSQNTGGLSPSNSNSTSTPSPQPGGPSPSNSNSTSTPSPQPKAKTSAILGGVLGGLLGAAAVLSTVLFLLRRRRLREEASRRPEPADEGVDSPEHYEGGSTWSPPPHEMYVPKPTHELGDGVTPELGDAAAFELNDSSVSSRHSTVETGVV